MVGGGQGSFIGAVHRIAANLDGQIELVCGCFSSRPENSLATGQSLFYRIIVFTHLIRNDRERGRPA